MKFAKHLFTILTLMLISVSLPSCGSDSDDDEPEFENTELAGTWKCTDADVLSIEADGMAMPDFLKELLEDQIESSLIGSTTVIDASKVKVDGDVIIFEGTGIKWHIQSMKGNEMTVIYDTDNSYQGMSIKMKIKAEFKKIR